jgi:uncharacterized protein (UPF0276 family)
MTQSIKKLSGVGMGFRRELIPAFKEYGSLPIDFFEIAPENWMGVGGKHKRALQYFMERYPFVCHGLSLSIGGTESLDVEFLKRVKQFLDDYQIPIYTEHLSWCTDDGHLYDLLPIPCTQEAVNWVVGRIQQVQDLLGRQIGVENVSYYIAHPDAEMTEVDFINSVVKTSDCFLHLDVNNIYVNSKNFNFDAEQYLCGLPLNQVQYIHIAGHYTEPDGLLVDTHGAKVIDPVWDLLASAYSKMTNTHIPTCLERDFNFPELPSLINEVEIIRQYQQSSVVQLVCNE